MSIDNTDRVLANLVKIERGLSKVYRHFSNIESFSNPVKKFWLMLSKEEDKHAELFEAIAKRRGADDSFELSLSTDNDQLKKFVDQVNTLLKEVKNKPPSEVESYSLGAKIEAELNEAQFLSNIATNDPQLLKNLQKIDLDTKKHNMLLINHARGYT